jgi:hypothetical protein
MVDRSPHFFAQLIGMFALFSVFRMAVELSHAGEIPALSALPQRLRGGPRPPAGLLEGGIRLRVAGEIAADGDDATRNP